MKQNAPLQTAGCSYKIPKSVRAVLFDAVGTLIVPSPPVAEAYLAAGRQFGSQLTIEEVRQRFRDAFGRQERWDASQGERTSEQRERQRWQSIVAEVFHEATEQRELFEMLWAHFARPEHWQFFDDVPPMWAKLRTSGLQLGIASNFDARLQVIIAGLPILSQANWLFVSSQVGCRKPDARFFQTIEHSLALSPEQLLLVGDDLENDYRGARTAGWHAVLLARSGVAPLEVEHWITSLDDLNIAS
jgi:putative hydrolase of the HAD superfamily